MLAKLATGLITPTFYKQHLHMKITKAQKGTARIKASHM